MGLIDRFSEELPPSRDFNEQMELIKRFPLKSLRLEREYRPYMPWEMEYFFGD
jgi:hypothetical protein